MYIPSATDIGGITMYDIPYLKYDIDEDGNCTTISGKPKVESVFMTFKNLEKGSIPNGQFNKEYSTAFLNDLPDWSGNTTTHSLTLGIHFDLKYDPELQTELLKVGNSYTPTINVSGGPTTNKNWDLKVNWNGTSDGGAYMTPYVPAIEFSSNDLPENYTRCNYLESNGNQYIKTDYVPTGTTGMYVDAYKTGGDMICGCTEYWYYWGGGNFILLGYNTYYGDVQYNRDTKGRMKAPYHYVGRLNYKNDRTRFQYRRFK